MKKLFLVLLIVSFIILSTTAFAAEKAPFKTALGSGNVAFKFDYINFTEDLLDDFEADDGYYIGLEAYGQIAPNLYLGMESGYAKTDGTITAYLIDYPYIYYANVDSDLTFVPVELNLKYAIGTSPYFTIDFGAGVSYNYVEEELSALGLSISADDWLFGGQFFIDLNYKFDQWFFGINAKYQITEDFEEWGHPYGLDLDHNLNNWRIGGQIGFLF